MIHLIKKKTNISGEGGLQLTTQIRCSPFYTHILVTAGLCVGCHSCAEALELSFKLAGAGLQHTGMVVGLWIHLAIVEHPEFEPLSTCLRLLCEGLLL